MKMTSNICSGTLDQIKKHEGTWAFVDLGFSNKKKTCGLLVCSDNISSDAECLTFGDLENRLKDEQAKKCCEPLHLVLEAPLSASFDHNRNPVGRSLEKDDSHRTRYWYVGLGCSVLVAALYLVRSLTEHESKREIRIFEGFVSFKDKSEKSDHQADVRALRDTVFGTSLDTKQSWLKAEGIDGEQAESILGLLGLDVTPPPIIRAEVSS